MKTIVIIKATQIPNIKMFGRTKKLPSANFNGIWIYDKIDTKITAVVDRKVVRTKDKRVADIATGASIKTANGLVNPPQRYSKDDSWKRSNIKTIKVKFSDNLLVFGKHRREKKFREKDTNIKRVQYTMLSSRLITLTPMNTAMVCPIMASHLKFVSVLRKTRSFLSKSNKTFSFRLVIKCNAKYISSS